MYQYDIQQRRKNRNDYSRCAAMEKEFFNIGRRSREKREAATEMLEQLFSDGTLCHHVITAPKLNLCARYAFLDKYDDEYEDYDYYDEYEDYDYYDEYDDEDWYDDYERPWWYEDYEEDDYYDSM